MKQITMKTGQEYTIAEVAEYCDIHYHTVWRAITAKALTSRWDTRHSCHKILFEDVLSWRSRVAKRKAGKQRESEK